MHDLPATAGGDALLRTTDPDDLAASVLDAAGVRLVGLDAFLELAAVEWCRSVRTACVELQATPRLLLNPDFVAAQCTTPERLAFLLMHELAHVSLGHTRLFARITPAQNVAFDVLINRMVLEAVMHAHGPRHVAAYAELPCALYDAAEAPWFLLRPPPGWPQRPEWHASCGMPDPLRAIHRRLYARESLDDWTTVTAAEVLRALTDTVQPSALRPASDPDALGDPAVAPHGPAAADDADGNTPADAPDDGAADAANSGPHAGPGGRLRTLLLGSHDATAREVQAQAGGGARELIGQLPDLFRSLRVRGAEETRLAQHHMVLARRNAEVATTRALRQVIRKTLVSHPSGVRAVTPAARGVVTPWRGHDRRAAARERLAAAYGAPPPLLFTDDVPVARAPRRTAAIYLDVSGSMEQLLPPLHAALVPLRRELSATVHLFSTVVVTARAADFDRGMLASTGGTSVEPVLTHLVAQGHRAPRRALLVTDGYFGAPSAAMQRALRALSVALHVLIVGAGPAPTRQPWVQAVYRLALPTAMSP